MSQRKGLLTRGDFASRADRSPRSRNRSRSLQTALGLLAHTEQNSFQNELSMTRVGHGRVSWV
jgi:hypothetical protein